MPLSRNQQDKDTNISLNFINIFAHFINIYDKIFSRDAKYIY